MVFSVPKRTKPASAPESEQLATVSTLLSHMVRLIQQEPAWALHAYLRFLNIDYHTENTFACKALGFQLPIIVDSATTKTESMALNYLSSRYSQATAEMSADAVFSAYLKQALAIPFQQLRRNGRTDKKNLFRVLPIGLNVAYGVMDDIHEFFCGDRFDPLPGATEAELLESIARVYGEINDSLLLKIAQGHAPTFTQLHGHLASAEEQEDLISASMDRLSESGRTSPVAGESSPETGPKSPSKAQRAAMQGGGIAEAVLFGHIASVLCTHEQLGAILVRYEGLLIFFQYICTTYFTDPYIDATNGNSDDLHWKSSMNALLANKFLDQECSEPVKSCLLYGTPIPCTGLLEGGSYSYSAESAEDVSGSLDFASAEDDFYPHGEDKPLSDTNPLFSPTSGRPLLQRATSSKGSAKFALVKTDVDPYLVRDEPTTLTKVNFDLSFSTPWRSAYGKLLGILGYPQPAVKSAAAAATPAGVHTVGLGGAAVLVGVTGCFAGYAFYARKMR